eukprot:scaffold2987_cov170-Amphora_coffeaeformis.AAC.38
MDGARQACRQLYVCRQNTSLLGSHRSIDASFLLNNEREDLSSHSNVGNASLFWSSHRSIESCQREALSFPRTTLEMHGCKNGWMQSKTEPVLFSFLKKAREPIKDCPCCSHLGEVMNGTIYVHNDTEFSFVFHETCSSSHSYDLCSASVMSSLAQACVAPIRIGFGSHKIWHASSYGSAITNSHRGRNMRRVNPKGPLHARLWRTSHNRVITKERAERAKTDK